MRFSKAKRYVTEDICYSQLTYNALNRKSDNHLPIVTPAYERPTENVNTQHGDETGSINEKCKPPSTEKFFP